MYKIRELDDHDMISKEHGKCDFINEYELDQE